MYIFFFQKSYIFQKRPLTPPRILKQREYATDLAGQVQFCSRVISLASYKTPTKLMQHMYMYDI